MKEWNNIVISDDGTHHLMNGKPIYRERFDSVLKFHAPGLAPVCKDGKSWHIDIKGNAAYEIKYRNTFGFYCGLASVEDWDGWTHIRSSGSPLYKERYAWCGNFQEDLCPVRTKQGNYFHITKSGKPAYDTQWSYAGDYRDGIAVVQREDGLSTHVDVRGQFIHSQWFLDLDVFHKGFARARDNEGWFHLDKRGVPLYAHRYQMIEPFYNGQARVERFDGRLELIDQNGIQIHDIRPLFRSHFSELSWDLVGFWKTWTLCSAVETGILQHLPNNIKVISAECGLEIQMAQRLLYALGELEIVYLLNNCWGLTPKGTYLTIESDVSLAGASIEYAHHFNKNWSQLTSILYGSSKSEDIFEKVAKDTIRTERFHKMQRSYAKHDYTDVLSLIEIADGKVVVDAGCGSGFLSELLAKKFPGILLTLLDREEVLGMVNKELKNHHHLNLHPGNIFEPWLLQADVVILARVLHDWNDKQCLRILHHAQKALKTGGRIIIIEMVREDESFNGSLCDLHLLVNTGGAERNLTEFERILSESNLRIIKRSKTSGLVSVIEAVTV